MNHHHPNRHFSGANRKVVRSTCSSHTHSDPYAPRHNGLPLPTGSSEEETRGTVVNGTINTTVSTNYESADDDAETSANHATNGTSYATKDIRAEP